MDDYSKNKAGLHKEVSSIFSGVPIPTTDACAGDSSSGSEGVSGGTPARPPAIAPWNVHDSSQAETNQHVGASASLPKSSTPEPLVVLKASGPRFLDKFKERFFVSKPGVSAGRQKAMVLMIPVLAITLIFLLSRVLVTPARTVAKSQDSGPVEANLSFDGSIDWEVPAVYPANLRDPMVMPAAMAPPPVEPNDVIIADANTGPETGQPGSLVVKGIVFSSDKPSAVVGTEIVYEGDIVMGATILKINPSSVDFSRDGRTWRQNVEP